MTYEEAYDYGKNQYTNGKFEKLTIKQASYLSISMDALEKQIPKKPDYEADGYDDNGNLIYDTAFCPNCHNGFEVDYDNDKKYCPECGQALDWSDIE